MDVYINNTYYKSLKSPPYNISFIPKDVSGITNNNIIRIIGYDINGLAGEATDTFTLYP
jgi:hypothetical protein